MQKKLLAMKEALAQVVDNLLSQIWEKNPGLEVHPFKNIILR